MAADRSTRTLLAAILLLAALFVAMNRVIERAPLGDWWLPLLLFVVGAALAISPRFALTWSPRPPEDDEEAPRPSRTPALPASNVHTYDVTQSPRLHTMTIRPDPDLSQYDIRMTPAEEVLPYMEAMPSSGHGPSQGFPMEKNAEVAPPAPELTYSARTEYAEPDAHVAASETPAAPPSAGAAERADVAKEATLEKTSSPQQPYEVENVGTITTEAADRITSDSVDNAYVADVPVISEAASPPVAAQETSGAGVVGSSDNLQKLAGIGPKSAAALRALGINSYQKLANSTDDEIRAALSAGNVRLVGDVNTWAQQAAYAARGDWEGLERFNRERKAANGD